MPGKNIERILRKNLIKLDLTHMDALLLLAEAYIITSMELEYCNSYLPIDEKEFFMCKEFIDTEDINDLLEIADTIVDPLVDSVFESK